MFVFLKTLKCRKTFRSPKGSVRYLNLVVMANKLVSAEFLSFFFSALKVLVSLHLFHWPDLSNFAIFQNSLLFLSFLVFPKGHYSSRPTCVSPALSPHPCSYDPLWTCWPASFVFQMFACAGRVTLPMLSCCIASRWLNLYGAHNRFSVYTCHLNCWAFFVPGHHSIHSNTCHCYSVAKSCVTLWPHGL